MLFPILELSCSELIQGVAIVQCNPTHRLCYLHCRFWNDSSCENPSMFLFDCLFSFWHILFMFHVWLGQYGLDFSLTLTLCLCLGELRHKMYFVFLCKTCSCTQRREGFIRNKLLFFFSMLKKSWRTEWHLKLGGWMQKLLALDTDTSLYQFILLSG